VIAEHLGFAARYAAFAAVQVSLNLATQWVVFRIYDGPYAIYAALVAGTAVGLPVKFTLDKRWIFYDTETCVVANSRKFMLYSIMGVATTVIFWTTEILFHAMFEARIMTYVGGALGLAIGYWTKYRLDRRFVFRSTVARGENPE